MFLVGNQRQTTNAHGHFRSLNAPLNR